MVNYRALTPEPRWGGGPHPEAEEASRDAEVQGQRGQALLVGYKSY